MVTQGKSWLVNPQIPIPPEASRVHKITDEEVRGKPTAGEAIKELIPDLLGTILVAHNSAYDEAILSSAAAREGMWLPPLPFIDTIPLAKALIRDMDSYSLGNLSKALGFPAQTYHRALDDARTTVQLLDLCFKRLATLGEDNFRHLSVYGSLTRLGASAHPVKSWSPRFPLLRLAVATRAEFEIHYLKDNRTIKIPGTLRSAFTLLGHDYLEVQDHRKEHPIRTLRLDRVQRLVPL